MSKKKEKLIDLVKAEPVNAVKLELICAAIEKISKPKK